MTDDLTQAAQHARDAVLGILADIYGLGDHPDHHRAADRLVSAGLVRTPVTAAQIRQAAQALHDDPTSNTKGWLHLAHCAVKALGLSVVEGGEQRG